MSINPYQPPASTETGPPVPPDVEVSSAILDSLRLTRPHVSFIGWLCVVLIVLPLLLLFDEGLVLGEQVGVVLSSAMYVGVSLLLRKCAKAIGRAVESGRLADVELAIAAQATFWRCMGGLAIVFTLVLGGLFTMVFLAVFT